MQTQKLVERVAKQLRDASRQLIHLPPDEAFHYIADACRKELPIDFSAIAMADNNQYVLKSWRGEPHPISTTFPLTIADCTPLLTKEVVTHLHNIKECSLFQLMKNTNIRSWFTVPFKIDDTRFGFCLIGYLTPIELIPDMGDVFNEFGKDVGVSMLYQHEKNDKQQLEQLLRYQQLLLHETLIGDAFDGLTAKISTLLHNSVVLFDRFHHVLSEAWLEDAQSYDALTEQHPIHVGQEVFGYLALLHQSPPTHYVQLSIEVAKNIYAIQFMKQKIAFEAYEKKKEQLLDLLLQSLVNEQMVRTQANLLNIDLTPPFYIAVVDTTTNVLEKATSFEQHLTTIHYGEQVVLLFKEPDYAQALYKLIAQHAPTKMLSSRPLHKLQNVRVELLKLKHAIPFIEHAAVDYAQLGVIPLLQEITHYEHFVDEQLGPLNTLLLETLKSYLAHNGNASETAQNLFIHRSTLLYRVEKIETLLQCSLQHNETRFTLQLALKLKEIHNL